MQCSQRCRQKHCGLSGGDKCIQAILSPNFRRLIPPAIMQAYVVVMVLLVAGGTLFDIMHKKSARYFFNNWRNSKNKAKRQVGGGEMVSIAVQTAVVDVMTSGEFCNVQRRIAHLLTMYGFVIYVVTTAIMVFAYPTPATPTPAILPIAVVHRRADGLRRRLLVLVFHPGRRRRRGQFAVPFCARRLVRRLACPERDLWPGVGVRCRRRATRLGQPCSWRSISSPPRCCSDRSRGPSSLICSSSPLRPWRKEWPKQTARGATCRLPPTRQQNSAASSGMPHHY